MTPLVRFYARFLPARAIWLAVTLTYALGIVSVLFFGNESARDVIYIDMENDR